MFHKHQYIYLDKIQGGRQYVIKDKIYKGIKIYMCLKCGKIKNTFINEIGETKTNKKATMYILNNEESMNSFVNNEI